MSHGKDALRASTEAVIQELSDYYYQKALQRISPFPFPDRKGCNCLDCVAIKRANDRWVKATGAEFLTKKVPIYCGHVDHAVPCGSPHESRAVFREVQEWTIPAGKIIPTPSSLPNILIHD